MLKFFKKGLCFSLAFAMSLTAVPAFAESRPPQMEAVPAAEKGFVLYEEYAASDQESFETVDGNTIQTYVTEDGTEHKIYWSKGMTPPSMTGKGDPEGDLDHKFMRVIERSEDVSHRIHESTTLQAPYIEGKGYYDLNKTVMDNRCYLGAATNTLYWWMDQNAEYIQKFIDEVTNPLSTKFKQPKGLVKLPDVQGWDALRQAPMAVLTDEKMYSQRLDDTGFVKGPYANNYQQRKHGYYPDAVQDFIINGYRAITAEDDDYAEVIENAPENYMMDPNGGFFYTVFGTSRITKKHNSGKYDYYDKHMKEWIEEGKGIDLAMKSASAHHALTIWGAEYDETGHLCRLYVTDTDDYGNRANLQSQRVRGLHGMDVHQVNNAMYLNNRDDADSVPGGYVVSTSTLDLSQDIWKTVTNDADPEPGKPVITSQPQSRKYEPGSQVETLKVNVKIPEKDVNTGAYLTYQWYRAKDEQGTGSEPIKGAVQTNYTPVIGDRLEKQYYYCEVTNHKYGKEEKINTDTAVIEVTNEKLVHAAVPALRFYAQKEYVPENQKVRLEVTVLNPDEMGELSYQWYRAHMNSAYNYDMPIPGANSSSLEVDAPKNGEKSFYFCRVTNTDTRPEITGASVAYKDSGIKYLMGTEPIVPKPENVTGEYKVSEKNPEMFTYVLNETAGAEYRMDQGMWQDSPIFDEIEPESVHSFYVRIKGDDQHEAGAEAVISDVRFERLENPLTPEIKVDITVHEDGTRTLKISSDARMEYSFDGGQTYTDDPVKNGVKAGADVEAAVRYKQTAVYKPSLPAKKMINIRNQSQNPLVIQEIGEKHYGDPEVELEVLGGSGNGAVVFSSLNPDVAVIQENRLQIQNAGEVKIRAEKAGSGEYDPAETVVTLTIKPAEAVVKAAYATMHAGDVLPNFAWSVEGLIGDDCLEDVEITTDADGKIPGQYVLIPEGGHFTKGRMENYKITYTNGTLDILEPVKSEDPVEEFVKRLYTEILGREADPSGLAEWTEILKSGQTTGAEVSKGFVDSDEFKNKDMTDEAFLEIMYKTFLGRPSDEGGMDAWKKVLDDGMSRMFVFKGFVESEEFTKICEDYGILRGNVKLTAPMDLYENVTKFVSRCYRVFLGRKADPNGLNGWVSQLVSGSNNAKEAARGFVMSDEFQSKNLNNEDYVRTIYVGLLNREADENGLADWVKVLEQGGSREDIFYGFADSPEFRKLAKEYELENDWKSGK